MNTPTTQKPKILHLVEDMKTGGIERLIASIVSEHLQAFDFEVWCVARGGAIADELLEAGATVRTLDITSYRNPLKVNQLRSELRKANPAVVHTHGYYAGTIGRTAGKLAGIPRMIHHVHSTYIGYEARHHRMERWLSRFTHRVLCCSVAVKDFVVATEQIKGERLQVVYNGVELQAAADTARDDIRREFGISDTAPLLITVASLQPHKGHRFLLEAMPIIHADQPDVELLLVGEGPLRKDLETQASELGIQDRVHFAGRRSDVVDLLTAADLFVLPSSEREGLGIAIVEAMACGLPVIGSDIGGIPEVIQDGETGLLVPPATPDKLAAAILQLLNDAESATTFGAASRHRYENVFTMQRMAEQLTTLYLGP